MPIDDPPTEEKEEQIRDNRFESPHSFRTQLFERRLWKRYGMDPGEEGAYIYFYQCLSTEIDEKERKIQQLRKEVDGLRSVREWVKPMHEDALSHVAENRLDELQEATPTAFGTE